MSASAMPFGAIQHQPVPANNVFRDAWMPVLLTILFICFTSTKFMGGGTSQIVVDAIWKKVLGTAHWNLTGPVNWTLRKTGHFFGYGVVGLIFRKAWYRSAEALSWVMRSWLTPFASSLAVASTFLVACLDEWHQRFVPGRVGSIRDAMIDALGALLLNVFVWEIRVYRSKKALAKVR
jgi:VanZ family protein